MSPYFWREGARILEWVAIPFSRRSSLPRDWTQVFRIVSRHFIVWATRKSYLTVDFFSNWQCLCFKQIKCQLMWNSITKTWDFCFMKTENWNSFMPSMCLQSPWTMLCFYLGVECFPVRPLSSCFLVETWYRVHLLLPANVQDTAAQPTCSAYQPCSRTWFLLVLFFTYFISCAWWEYVTCCSNTIQLVFVFTLVPLLTVYVAYSSSFRGSAGLEKPCIQEACVQWITDQLHALWGSQETDL